MYKADKLSGELGIDYMGMFHKTNDYFLAVNSSLREDVRIHAIFEEKEIDFLACIALEMLQDKEIRTVLESGDELYE